ncbi:cupin domain-containing protein [Macrococcoides caseolyticum]
MNIRNNRTYTLMSVLSGEGTLTADGQVYTITKGDHFILTTEDKEIKLQGKLDIIESYV